MVGGRLIEMAQMSKAEPATWRLWCVDGNDECAVHVQVKRGEALPKLGEEIWWQSGKVYFNSDKSWLPKIGYSYDPRPPQAI